ncbi:MAG: hypothetical protein ABWZ79_16620 [Pedobacter agri]
MQEVVLRIQDQTGAGKIISEINISLKSNRVTVKEIIEARVIAEVEHAEKTLNGYKMKERKQVDAEKQIYIALDAFLKNGYFILIDNFQAQELEQQVDIKPSTQLSFVKLTPLVGG